jgi:hypothetical protein
MRRLLAVLLMVLVGLPALACGQPETGPDEVAPRQFRARDLHACRSGIPAWQVRSLGRLEWGNLVRKGAVQWLRVELVLTHLIHPKEGAVNECWPAE